MSFAGRLAQDFSGDIDGQLRQRRSTLLASQASEALLLQLADSFAGEAVALTELRQGRGRLAGEAETLDDNVGATLAVEFGEGRMPPGDQTLEKGRQEVVFQAPKLSSIERFAQEIAESYGLAENLLQESVDAVERSARHIVDHDAQSNGVS